MGKLWKNVFPIMLQIVDGFYFNKENITKHSTLSEQNKEILVVISVNNQTKDMIIIWAKHYCHSVPLSPQFCLCQSHCSSPDLDWSEHYQLPLPTEPQRDGRKVAFYTIDKIGQKPESKVLDDTWQWHNWHTMTPSNNVYVTPPRQRRPTLWLLV